ncbi:hypothetical protein BC834DRAFT_143148 [Gloeopeniophorella convolvens]|nr:hypothetical protein BC834DRAFT_143148 [Gloeopeniophorella convolvens]
MQKVGAMCTAEPQAQGSGQQSRQEGSSRASRGDQHAVPDPPATSAPPAPGHDTNDRAAQRLATFSASSPAVAQGRGQPGVQKDEPSPAPTAIPAGESAPSTTGPEVTNVPEPSAATGAVAPQRSPSVPVRAPGEGERAGSTVGVAAAEYIDQVATARALDDARRRDLHDFAQMHPAKQMILQSSQLAAMEQNLEAMKAMFEKMSDVMNKVAASTVPPWSQ